jgi:hypothetical protein
MVVQVCHVSIAISLTDSDRVYAGTGEGDTNKYFGTLFPAYRGIGPIISEDGGDTWTTESSSPPLEGFAFYDLAVDPASHDNVVAATSNGLYQRVLTPSNALWQQRRTDNHCSVVVARSGSTITFYAARWGGPIFCSLDGAAWSVIGKGFPPLDIGRIALSVQANNPDVLYALAADQNGNKPSVYRFDRRSGLWSSITGVPEIINNGGAGVYNLCTATDPNNVNIIYLGGNRLDDDPWPANIQRCTISSDDSGYSMIATSIGGNAHSDVHALVFEHGNSNRLWAATDGGCFLSTDPLGSGSFEGRNTGLSSLCTNYMGLSQSEPAITDFRTMALRVILERNYGRLSHLGTEDIV